MKLLFTLLISVTLVPIISNAAGKDVYFVPAFEIGTTPNRGGSISNLFGLYYQPSLKLTWMFSNHLGITSGAGYGYYRYIADGDYHYQDQQTATYIEVPFAAHLEAGNGKGRNVWFWADAGMSLAFNRSAEYRYTLNPGANTTQSKNVNNKNEMESVLPKAMWGLGFCRKLSESSHMIVGWQFSAGTTTHAKGNAFYAHPSNLVVASLKLGFMIGIGKKDQDAAKK